MPMPLQSIEAEALKLPLEERSQLVDRLLQSLEPDAQETAQVIAQAWDDEIARRVEAMDAGNGDSVAYEHVRAELRALIAAQRRDR